MGIGRSREDRSAIASPDWGARFHRGRGSDLRQTLRGFDQGSPIEGPINPTNTRRDSSRLIGIVRRVHQCRTQGNIVVKREPLRPGIAPRSATTRANRSRKPRARRRSEISRSQGRALPPEESARPEVRDDPLAGAHRSSPFSPSAARFLEIFRIFNDDQGDSP
jgi:hypothetical protein